MVIFVQSAVVTVFVRGLLFSDDGMSWNLKSALLLLCHDLWNMWVLQMKSVCQYFKIAVLVRSMFFSAVWPSLGRIKVMIKTGKARLRDREQFLMSVDD